MRKSRTSTLSWRNAAIVMGWYSRKSVARVSGTTRIVDCVPETMSYASAVGAPKPSAEDWVSMPNLNRCACDTWLVTETLMSTVFVFCSNRPISYPCMIAPSS